MSIDQLVQRTFSGADAPEALNWLTALSDCPRMAEWLELSDDRLADLEQLVCYELYSNGNQLSERGRIRALELIAAVSDAEDLLSKRVRDESEFRWQVQYQLVGLQTFDYLLDIPQRPWPRWRNSLNRLRDSNFFCMTRLPVKWDPTCPLLKAIRDRIKYIAKPLRKGPRGPEGSGYGVRPLPDRDPPPPPLESGSPARLARARYSRQVEGITSHGNHQGRHVGAEALTESVRQLGIAIEKLRTLIQEFGARRSATSALTDITVPLWQENRLVVQLDGIFEDLCVSEPEQAFAKQFIEYAREWIERLDELKKVIACDAR
jgi:hypothetical protein